MNNIRQEMSFHISVASSCKIVKRKCSAFRQLSLYLNIKYYHVTVQINCLRIPDFFLDPRNDFFAIHKPSVLAQYREVLVLWP